MATVRDQNLLSLWLVADHLPTEVVRLLIEEVDELRQRHDPDRSHKPFSWEPPAGFRRYEIPR